MELPENLKESGEFLDLVISLGNAAGKALEDGKVGYTDVIYFLDPLKKVMEAIEGADKAIAEIMNAPEMDRIVLVEYFKEKFDLPSDMVEKRIEDALAFGLSLFNYLKTWKKTDG